MGAAFTITDYMGPFLVYTIGSVLVAGILCVLLGRKLVIKFKRLWFAYLPLIGYALFLYLLGLHVLPVLEQTGDLLTPSEYQIKITAGEIDRVVPAEHVPLYYMNGEIRGANYIVIGEDSYYVISDGFLAEGMLVELQYAQFENNVVLSCQEVTADRVAIVLEEQREVSAIEKPKKQEKEVPQELQIVAQVLASLGLIGVLVLVAVNNLAHYRIANYLFKKDAAVHGQIIPNRLGAVFTAMPLVFFSMIIVGVSMMDGQIYGLLILILGGGMMLAFMLMEQSTYLKLDGQYILLKKLGKEKQYCMTDVYCVKWESCKGTTGKQLMIVFNDGKSCWFNMDHYMGVQNVYNELKKRLDDLSKA